MIQGWVPLSQRSGPEARRLRLTNQLLAQLGVVPHLKTGLGGAEGGHAPGCAGTG